MPLYYQIMDNAATECLLETAKVVLTVNSIAINAYIKKQERTQIKNLTLSQESRKRRRNEARSQQKEGNKDQNIMKQQESNTNSNKESIEDGGISRR